jgi:hypothetical protein
MRADNNRQALHSSPSHLDILQSVPMVGTDAHTSSHGGAALRAIVSASIVLPSEEFVVEKVNNVNLK